MSQAKAIKLDEISQLLEKEIVQVKEKDITLFDIAGFPHYENVSSNIYAYFLDPNQNHGLGTLFLDSLQELAGTSFDLMAPVIKREHLTKKGGRIDIAILSRYQPDHNEVEENAENQTKIEDEILPPGSDNNEAILIENKLYHHLANDLEDYWNSFYEFNCKQGIVLTLKEETVKHLGFINLTHEQLIEKVLSKLGSSILSVPEPTLYLLKEFCRNMKNFTMTHEANEYFTYYQDNFSKIKQLQRLTEVLEKQIWDQSAAVPEQLSEMGLELSGKYSSRLRYYITPKTKDVYFTIVPHLLDTENPYVKIMVELQKEGVKGVEVMFNEIVFTEEEKKFLKETNKKREGWLHFASNKFQLGTTNVDSLSDFIADKIENTPLKTIFQKVEAYLASLPKKHE